MKQRTFFEGKDDLTDEQEKIIRQKKKELVKSSEYRDGIKKKYGEIPSSVWQVRKSMNKTIQEFDRILKKRSYQQSSMMADGRWRGMEVKDPVILKRLSVSGMTCRGKKGGLSTFPYEICQRIYRYYSERGDNILDPFSGRITRMLCAFNEKRNYIGYDVSENFYKQNKKARKHLLKGLIDTGTTITLHLHTSEKMFEEDESQDLIFSSPPYWDLEWYGDEDDQLGKCKEYAAFLDRLRDIISECHRVIKTDKFVVLNVNDFRKNGVYYIYHQDVINLATSVGLKPWDIIIMDWGSSIRQAFAMDVETSKIVAKQHEYILVFRK